jgi:hypothetical protein
MGGNRHAALASARGTGRAAYTKDVGRTKISANITIGVCLRALERTMKELVTWLIHTRSGKLVATFLSFLLIQFTFAALYFWRYKQRPEDFVFGADILKGQSVNVRRSSEESIAQLTTIVETLREAMSELDRGAAPVVTNGDASLTLPSGRRCVVVFMSGPPAGGPAGSRFTLVNTDGVEFLDADPTEKSFRGWLESAMWLDSAAKWRPVVSRLLNEYEMQLTATSRRLESLASPRPDVWSFWDFLYFSTIVQTTVGFGDILPNSTVIRMLVVIQILLGYTLLVVVLNIVMSA